MPVSKYISILWHYRLSVLTPAIMASMISLGIAFTEPPRYRSSTSILITRSEDRRFDTEDALAYDLPAIVKGAPFSIEVSSALARSGIVITPEQARAALGASNQRRVVQIWAETGEPALSEALTAAAVEVVQQRGLALWGDPSATPGRTFVNVVVLEPPGPAVRTNDWRAGVSTAVLRGLAGLVAGALLALGAHRWETGRISSERETGG
ncbi:MAG: lipopolysaccharide biosynthesis protein [Roseiflexus sp.]